VRAAAELLNEYEFEIESLQIIPSRGGVFELTVDGDLLYSKRATGHHAGEGELLRLVKGKMGK